MWVGLVLATLVLLLVWERLRGNDPQKLRPGKLFQDLTYPAKKYLFVVGNFHEHVPRKICP